MSETKLGTWTVPESPLTIEYSLVVVDEIRKAVTEGYQALSRGGIEVGGVLYGVREGETIRILATRPIACEHARGPAFQFSENDRAALAAQLKQAADDPLLGGFECLGWFVSHTRTGIQLLESDLEIYQSFFPQSWQVTLIVRPGRAVSMRAGFFIREFDGTLHTESSYLEFSFPDRLAALLDRSARTGAPDHPAPSRRGSPQPIRGIDFRVDSGSSAVPAMHSYASSSPAFSSPEQEPLEAPQFEAPLLAPPAPARKNWIWLVVWAAVLVGLALVGWHYFAPRAQPEPVGLALAEKDGVLQVQWNHAAKPIVDATRGDLEINDGKQSRTISLSASDLALGSFAYQRSTGDIEVRLVVDSPDGAKVQEVSRYLGSAPVPAKTADTQALEHRRDELQEEVERLRRENSQQTAHIQQLERTIRILQTRLGQK